MTNTAAVATTNAPANPSVRMTPGDSFCPPLSGCAALWTRAACRTVASHIVSAAAAARPASADRGSRQATTFPATR
jgi:hypothetical protein